MCDAVDSDGVDDRLQLQTSLELMTSKNRCSLSRAAAVRQNSQPSKGLLLDGTGHVGNQGAYKDGGTSCYGEAQSRLQLGNSKLSLKCKGCAENNLLLPCVTNRQLYNIRF